jgi:invasion protein IalB
MAGAIQEGIKTTFAAPGQPNRARQNVIAVLASAVTGIPPNFSQKPLPAPAPETATAPRRTVLSNGITGAKSRPIPKQKVYLVRITAKLVRLAAASALGLVVATAGAGMALAQKSDNQNKQFGPRAQNGQGQSGQQVPPTETVSKHGDWTIQCGKGDNPDGGRQCGMVQSTKSEKNPQAVLTLIIGKMKQGEKDVTMMRVMAPIGVFLPTGVALEIDGAAVGRVPFTRCAPQLCMAIAEASPETLVKLKKGTGANFIIYEAPGVGLPMAISLTGFSDALANLEKL